jgi:hypothetical protein
MCLPPLAAFSGANVQDSEEAASWAVHHGTEDQLRAAPGECRKSVGASRPPHDQVSHQDNNLHVDFNPSSDHHHYPFLQDRTGAAPDLSASFLPSLSSLSLIFRLNYLFKSRGGAKFMSSP